MRCSLEVLQKQLTNLSQASASEQMAEEARRDAEDDRIDNLPRHQRQEARQNEDERRSAWDVQHISPTETDGSSTLGSSSLAPSVPSQGTTLNNSSATSSTLDTSSGEHPGSMPPGNTPPWNVPPRPAPPGNVPIQASAMPPGSSPPSPEKRSKWRFKLKRKKSNRT